MAGGAAPAASAFRVPVVAVFLDLIIRSLRWDNADPKVCHPEFPRPFPRRVYYALLAAADVDSMVNGLVVPDVFGCSHNHS